MKKKNVCFISMLLLVFILFSCDRSPANISAGEYDGFFTRDTVVAGHCTTKVTVVNPLTVNFSIDLDSTPPSFNLTNVEVNGGNQPYALNYTGIEGTLTGSVTENNMSWILMGLTDTFSFTGLKK